MLIIFNVPFVKIIETIASEALLAQSLQMLGIPDN
jgi:hypothetical protein